MDALEDTLTELPSIEATVGGKVTKLVIHYMIERPDGSAIKKFVAAGVNTPEHIGLLEIGKDQVIRGWRCDD